VPRRAVPRWSPRERPAARRVRPGRGEAVTPRRGRKAGASRARARGSRAAGAHALAVTARQLDALLAAHEFTRRLGARVEALGPGACTLLIPYRSEHDRPGGIVSGQLYMHAADVAFWFATKTLLGLDDASVTSSLSTAFLGSARAEAFTCRARILKLGGRLVYGVAECRAGDRALTHHTLTYARPAAPRPGDGGLTRRRSPGRAPSAPPRRRRAGRPAPRGRSRPRRGAVPRRGAPGSAGAPRPGRRRRRGT